MKTCKCGCGKIPNKNTNCILGHGMKGQKHTEEAKNKIRKSRIGKRKKNPVSKNPLYKMWNNMMSRCYNKNVPRYKDWGGRGIKVCDEWKNDHFSFYKWVKKNGYNKDLQLDRIDNDKDYCPENCRFVTQSINQSNTRLQKNNTSGFRGVYFNGKKYVSQFKGLHLGMFITAKDACIARDKYIIYNKLSDQIQILCQ